MTFTDRLDELLADASGPRRDPHTHAQYAAALLDTARELLVELDPDPDPAWPDPLAADEAALLLLAAAGDLDGLEPLPPSTAPWFPLDPLDPADPALVVTACLRLMATAAEHVRAVVTDQGGEALALARAATRIRTAQELLAPLAIDPAPRHDQPR